jgi:hypothetical protein
MRSSFYFLPASGYCFQGAGGERIDVDFFSVDDWRKYGFSPVVPAHSKRRADGTTTTREEATEEDRGSEQPRVGDMDVASLPRMEEPHPPTRPALLRPAQGSSLPDTDTDEVSSYLERTFSRVRGFRDISARGPLPDLDYPPIAIIASDKTATVKGCYVDSIQDIKKGDYSRLLYAEGDGIVLYESALALPESWKGQLKGTINSSHGHVSLLGDLKSVGQALELVL